MVHDIAGRPPPKPNKPAEAPHIVAECSAGKADPTYVWVSVRRGSEDLGRFSLKFETVPHFLKGLFLGSRPPKDPPA